MVATHHPFNDPAVSERFSDFPEPARRQILALRELIFGVAAQTPGVGRLHETLKWGQPAYLTPQTKSGSTLRLGHPKGGGFAIYAHCQTTIISEFRHVFADEFTYDGNRAVLFRDDDPAPPEKLAVLIRRALTYHQHR